MVEALDVGLFPMRSGLDVKVLIRWPLDPVLTSTIFWLSHLLDARVHKIREMKTMIETRFRLYGQPSPLSYGGGTVSKVPARARLVRRHHGWLSGHRQ